MTDEVVSDLCGEPALDSGVVGTSWKRFLFNYNGSAYPLLNELSYSNDVTLCFSLSEHFITYMISPADKQYCKDNDITIEEPILMLVLSTTNSAHSLSELLSFLNFYRTLSKPPIVGVNSIIVDRLPFLYQIFCKFVPEAVRMVLDGRRVYRAKKVWFRRNNHMVFGTNWASIPYASEQKILRFSELDGALEFSDSPEIFRELSRATFEKCKDSYPIHEKIVLIKTRDGAQLTTPQRAMDLTAEVKREFEGKGFRVISVSDFSNIDEYLTVLYGAKVVITSYGGAACTNRFFLSPEADVVLLANLSYKFEYEYSLGEGAPEYWHLRHSHLFPVRAQTVLLDQSDCLEIDDVANILSLIR